MASHSAGVGTCNSDSKAGQISVPVAGVASYYTCRVGHCLFDFAETDGDESHLALDMKSTCLAELVEAGRRRSALEQVALCSSRSS